jgi:3-hydroxyisobutyrate dehydrogenase-like beta-hydroxyacid dehydrogenase
VNSDELRWGVIGFGEAGSAFAHHLSSRSGRPVRVTDPLLRRLPLSESVAKRLAGMSVEIEPDIASLVQECDVVLSLVTPRVTAEVAAAAAAGWRTGLFVDFNSLSPTEKQPLAGLFPGGDYVDGAILGSVTHEAAYTNLILAGPRAEEASACLRAVDFRVRVLGSDVGVASAVKVCRSIFMKGIECLLVETLLAADKFNTVRPVLDSIEQTVTSYGFQPMVEMLVTTHAQHCGRRFEEMRSATAMLEHTGMPGQMSGAARDFLDASNRTGVTTHFDGSVPRDFLEVIAYLREFYEKART